MRVLVTGGSGIVGHYVVDELYKRGHTVINADTRRMGSLSHSANTGPLASAEAAMTLRASWPQVPKFFEVAITNYGQVVSAMDGCEAVISLASRPSSDNYVEEDIVMTNTMSMWNVCRSAEQLKVRRVVLGSSYNAVGAMSTAARWNPREVKPPDYFPLDDEVYTRAEDAYSVAKWLGEEIGQAFARRSPWMAIASLRFNGMWDDGYFRVLAAKPVTDVWNRCQGFWTYLHIRDAARACVMAIESDPWTGHRRLFLNADDSMISVPTMEAIQTVYPNVPVRERLEGFRALISTELARQVIGWRPLYSWRDPQFQPG